MSEINKFRSQLDGKTLLMVDRLRAIVAASHHSLIERIKWNAPSFAIDGDDRITLGIERKGGVRLVLHRGAKPKPNSGFAFDDADGLAEWPAADRGVIVWRDVAGIDRSAPQLTLLCRRWLEHVRDGG